MSENNGSTWSTCVAQTRIEHKLYAALMTSPSKALFYYCTKCHRKRSIVKQLYKLQSELMVAQVQWLASMYAVDVVRDLNKGLKADKVCLQVDELLELLYKKRVTDEHKAE